MKVSQALVGFEGRSQARTWLHSIVRNVALDHLRRVRRRGHATALDEAGDLPTLTDGPFEVLLRAETEARLHRAMRRLSPKHQAVLITRLAGLSSYEGARALGIAPGTFKSRSFRGLMTLTAQLQAESRGKETATH